MAVGNQTPADVATEYAALAFIVRQKISQISTLSLARVIDCTNAGGIVPVGTCTVEVLVNIMSGDRVAFPHKPIYHVPYLRVQGGNSAVILDPRPGDVGLVGFCERDISAVKAAKNTANPGSFRMFSKADAVYLFTCLGGTAPTQYVVLNEDGVTVVSPSLITLQAPTVRILGELQQSNGDASFAQSVDVGGDLTAQGEVTGNGIPVSNHGHPTAPTGPISPPQAL